MSAKEISNWGSFKDNVEMMVNSLHVEWEKRTTAASKTQTALALEVDWYPFFNSDGAD